jgi:hypothetical protein
MMAYRKSDTTSRVREPVQVYLDGPDQERLERLTGRLGATKSDVLRRGLQALEQQVSDPSRHPALRIAGLLRATDAVTEDAAREHDRVLADAEEESWPDNGCG